MALKLMATCEIYRPQSPINREWIKNFKQGHKILNEIRKKDNNIGNNHTKIEVFETDKIRITLFKRDSRALRTFQLDVIFCDKKPYFVMG